MKGILFIMSGPSGAGKTTIVKGVLKNLEDLAFSISYTTRPKREGEEEGKDYFFVDESTFRNLIKKKRFFGMARGARSPLRYVKKLCGISDEQRSKCSS